MNSSEETRVYTCIVCPKGCEITARQDSKGELSISGASCSKGEDYVRKEMLDPRRILTTSVLVLGGDEPLVSVRTKAAIPRRLIGEAMEIIRQIKLNAPVQVGTVVIADLLSTGIPVVTTREVEKNKKGA